ncbi:hypothetical protein GCM10009039_14320 [Halocalculus aciditolerans]|uniref:Uncharacterized protein n=2 Tax=Halocalculus aciditolerans TaxID=1383812 RepID=A0A830F5S4_9EURY|nr:hypothetical protein GCM10009039_14320 [Halocalculus aciditolerans]
MEEAMSVVQRAGRWTLGEKAEGVFVVKKGGQLVAKIITGEYTPGAADRNEAECTVERVVEVGEQSEVAGVFRETVADRCVRGFDRPS